MSINLEGKKLLVLGGTRIQCQLIKAAQSMGAYVVVTDYNGVNDSPGKLIADKHFMVSTTDVDNIVDLISKEKIDGVLMGYSDSILPYMARICEKANLPCYGTEEQFELFSHKAQYKKVLSQYGIPVVNGYEISDNLTDQELSNIRFPVLVKPSDGSGSRGIRVCHKKDEFKPAYLNAKKWSKCGDVIVEDYLTGDEVVAFWFVQNGEAYLTALGNWHKESYYEGRNALGVAYTFPSKYLSAYENNIVPKVKTMFHELNIKNGMMFMQCFIHNGVPEVYDIGYRLTGTLDYKIINAACGFDPMKLMIEHSLTGTYSQNIRDKADPHFHGHYGWNISFLVRPGKISRIEGVENIKQAAGVIDAVPAHGIGDEITEEQKGFLTQIVLRVLGVSDSLEAMEKQMKTVQSMLQVYNENNESLLLETKGFRQFFDLVERK